MVAGTVVVVVGAVVMVAAGAVDAGVIIIYPYGNSYLCFQKSWQCWYWWW